MISPPPLSSPLQDFPLGSPQKLHCFLQWNDKLNDQEIDQKKIVKIVIAQSGVINAIICGFTKMFVAT